jgi:hypothetical protein
MQPPPDPKLCIIDVSQCQFCTELEYPQWHVRKEIEEDKMKKEMERMKTLFAGRDEEKRKMRERRERRARRKKARRETEEREYGEETREEPEEIEEREGVEEGQEEPEDIDLT